MEIVCAANQRASKNAIILHTAKSVSLSLSLYVFLVRVSLATPAIGSQDAPIVYSTML